MDINRLNEFITLATLLNYSKAANQLYLTQPALSRHIHDLEQTLGTQLFIRDTHNVHLTSVGEIFLKEAQEIAVLCLIIMADRRLSGNGHTLSVAESVIGKGIVKTVMGDLGQTFLVIL